MKTNCVSFRTWGRTSPESHVFAGATVAIDAWLDEYGKGQPAHTSRSLLDVQAGDLVVHRWRVKPYRTSECKGGGK
jgi:hypothetical protein